MFLPHFDVLCDLLLNRSTATWNLHMYLFYIIKKQTSAAFLFQHLSSFLISRPLANTKKPFDVICRLHTMKLFHFLLYMRSKELWWSSKNHATLKLDLNDLNGFSWKLTAKELNCKIHKTDRQQHGIYLLNRNLKLII